MRKVLLVALVTMIALAGCSFFTSSNEDVLEAVDPNACQRWVEVTQETYVLQKAVDEDGYILKNKTGFPLSAPKVKDLKDQPLEVGQQLCVYPKVVRFDGGGKAFQLWYNVEDVDADGEHVQWFTSRGNPCCFVNASHVIDIE